MEILVLNNEKGEWNMKIKISNAGHVKEAVIEEKQLTVIVGDNGTGKTLLLEALAFTKKRIAEELSESIKKAYDQFEPYFRTDFALESHQIFQSNGYQSERAVTVGIECVDRLNEFFANECREIIHKVESEIGKRILFDQNSDVKIELLDCLRLESSSTVDVKIEPSLSSAAFLVTLSNSLQKTVRKRIYKTPLFNQKVINELRKNELENIDDLMMDEEKLIAKMKEVLIMSWIELHFRSYVEGGNILFLPSERNLHMTNAVSQLIKKLDGSNTNIRYSELLFMQDYLAFKENKKVFNFDTDDQFEELFEGQLEFDEDGEVAAIKQKSTTIKRPLFSTRLNRMIPYLILSSPFQNFKSIIIEEPEAHLSLKSMKEIISFFEYLIEKGYSLVITTHSDVFFSRLNNLFIKNPSIETNVYELCANESGSVLEEKTKTDLGYEIELFNEELDDLYEETLELQKED